MSQNRLHDFEKELNRKLGGHELDVPEHIWPAIEAERNPAKKERWPILLLLFLFIGLGAVGFWAYNSFSEDAQLAKLEITEGIKRTESEDLAEEANQAQLTESAKMSDVQSSMIEETMSSGETELTNTSEQNNAVKKANNKMSDDAVYAQNSAQEGLLSDTENTNTQSRERDLAQALLLKNKQQFSMVSPLEKEDMAREVDIPERSLDCPVFSDRGMMTDISIEFGVGPALSFHQISAQAGYADFLTARLMREEPLVNYGAHVRIKKEWANNTTAGIGFNLTSFNYQFKRVDSNEVRRTIITIDTFYQGHDYSTTVDTLLLIEQGIREHRSGMTHRLLSFPVSFGYKVEIDKLFIEPYLGATFNILQEASWSEDMFSDLIEGPADDVMAYRTSLGVMAHAGLTLGYELNSRWSVILQPEYHHSWSSITEPDMPVTENRNWLNINAGVKYKLWQTKKMR